MKTDYDLSNEEKDFLIRLLPSWGTGNAILAGEPSHRVKYERLHEHGLIEAELHEDGSTTIMGLTGTGVRMAELLKAQQKAQK